RSTRFRTSAPTLCRPFQLRGKPPLLASPLQFKIASHIFTTFLNAMGLSMNGETGTILADHRTSSGLTQRQVAERLSANQTRVSRIEAGVGDEEDVKAFLAALGTAEAQAFAELLALKWTHLPRPSMHHPDLETLIVVERGLGQVREFLRDS